MTRRHDDLGTQDVATRNSLPRYMMSRHSVLKLQRFWRTARSTWRYGPLLCPSTSNWTHCIVSPCRRTCPTPQSSSVGPDSGGGGREAIATDSSDTSPCKVLSYIEMCHYRAGRVYSSACPLGGQVTIRPCSMTARKSISLGTIEHLVRAMINDNMGGPILEAQAEVAKRCMPWTRLSVRQNVRL